MTARYLALLVGLAGVVASSFSACSGPSRTFDPPDEDGGAPAAGGSAGATGGTGATCSFSEERCDGLVPQRCSEVGDWVPTRASCAVACLAGQCVPCTEDATSCQDGAVQKCVAGAWTPIEVCPKVCEVDTCVDACTEGLYQCNGTQSLQQCVGGDFIDDSECEVLCIDGACGGECVPDTRRCNPDAPDESQACNAQGDWDVSAPCASDTFCVAGDCKPCSPDTTQCSESGRPQLCSEAGEWVDQDACTDATAVCHEGGCVACTPGERKCSGDVIEECLPDGSAWEVFETCSGETPACLDATKTCGRCTEGETQCLDDAVQTCDDQGAFQTTETCDGSTPQCFEGECTECGSQTNLTRCGNSCVNLATDTSNCLSCGNGCTPPANGTAVCTATGCDISCTNTRCGTSCCGATPARSTAGCSGNTCTFTCSSGNHGCGGETPPCYANTDGTHCGASCLDCGSYVGTTGACSSDQCTCESSTSLACGSNVPTCGSWDFNSNTVEGWRFGNYQDSSLHRWTSSLGTAITNGSPALAASFDATVEGYGTAEFEVDLCPNGAILNLSSYRVSYDVYFLTTGGLRFSRDDAPDSFMVNNTSVLLACQPFTEPASDEWIHGECANLPASMTNLTIVFRVEGWAGTIFLDNVRFTPE